jgi:hypothetical protein
MDADVLTISLSAFKEEDFLGAMGTFTDALKSFDKGPKVKVQTGP